MILNVMSFGKSFIRRRLERKLRANVFFANKVVSRDSHERTLSS